VRIIGGSMRGLKLAEVGVGDVDAHLRPTSDRVREAIFNLLTNGSSGNRVTEARVLDLFAGTGALGLEALSRGAAHATFVDDGIAAHALLRENIHLTKVGAQCRVVRRDATNLGLCEGEPYDLVFLDPPYSRGLGEQALNSALQSKWLSIEANVVWEEASPQPPPPGFILTDQRRYGDTWITLLTVRA